MIGKLFNQRYEIIEKLGSGGTAIVYKGQDTLLGRMVTVKILREECASNEDFVRRFRREAQAVASLSHGNIVSVYDVGFEKNMHYIVMEFVEGQSLKEYIKSKGVLEVQEAAAIMIQILDGLSYAHEHGIVHRDIKPHNILLGTDGRAKVTDFGIAVGMSDVTQTYNTSSRIMGSVHYIAPEQVQGQPVTEKSDIYSAGVVFYEALTGQLPFSGDTPISIAMQHVQGELILPHQINPRIPIGLSYVVMRAMRKNPETRYDSAKEMADAIRSVAEGLTSIYAPLPEENIENTRELDLQALDIAEKGLVPSAPRQPVSRSARREAKERRAPKERPERSAPPRRRVNFMAIVLLIMVIAFVGAVVWAMDQFKMIFAEDEKVIVPDVLGRVVEEAEAELLELGLTPVTVRRNDETITVGHVMQQSPSAEREVTPGTTVTLTVSDGPKQTEVPQVVGETEMMAEYKLSQKGLIPSYLEPEFSEDFPEGEVIRQDPAAGKAVDGGTEVVLVLSKGTEPVPVKVPGGMLEQSLADAKAMLEAVNLICSVKYEPSNVYYPDIVIAQSVPAGTELNEGDTVTLTISQGPGPTSKTASVSYQVPNDGMSHHLRVVVSDSNGEREVFSQNLSPGYNWQESVSYFGQGTVTVYLDGVAQSTEQL